MEGTRPLDGNKRSEAGKPATYWRKQLWSYNTPEAEAARYLIAEIKKAVENAEPDLRPAVNEIAAQIMRDLDSLALSTREHI